MSDFAIASPARTRHKVGATPILWALIAIYAVARVGQAFPDRVPMLAIVGSHVLAPLFFAFVHGARRYGLRGMLVFAALCLIIGNALENLSVLTGFPFGHYHFSDVMGPKLFNVPILLGLAYIGLGYLSWTLALIILGDLGDRLSGARLVSRPLVATFIMVAWDLSMDPIWSNLVHGWTWHDGGAYFGVPVSNFLGWYLTVYLIFQSFALYLRGRSTEVRNISSRYWQLAILLYGVSAAGNLFVISPPSVAEVVDGAGVHWSVSGILGASALVSIFVMGAFALLAWVRLTDAKPLDE